MSATARPTGPDQNCARVLAAALDDLLTGTDIGRLAAAVARLSTAYRASALPTTPILANDLDVAAYAAYRMPATYAAVRGALVQALRVAPDLSARTVLDLGAGTGAASWAIVDALAPESIVAVEQSSRATEAGRILAADAPSPALQQAQWLRRDLSAPDLDLPAAELAVAAYLLGELDERTQKSLVRRAAERAATVVLVEPGTPAGYRRILEARRVLIEAGMTIYAPCPHDLDCPLAAGPDWCHFAVRVDRSARHRRLKEATLGYEDEKFSFVAAGRAPALRRPAGRVLRHPMTRKGLVSLQLCTADGRAGQALVSKRQGPAYRSARGTQWGDEWPAYGEG